MSIIAKSERANPKRPWVEISIEFMFDENPLRWCRCIRIIFKPYFIVQSSRFSNESGGSISNRTDNVILKKKAIKPCRPDVPKYQFWEIEQKLNIRQPPLCVYAVNGLIVL